MKNITNTITQDELPVGKSLGRLAGINEENSFLVFDGKLYQSKTLSEVQALIGVSPGGNVGAGTVDYSTLRYSTGTEQWLENLDFITSWVQGDMTFDILSSPDVFGGIAYLQMNDNNTDDSVSIAFSGGMLNINAYNTSSEEVAQIKMSESAFVVKAGMDSISGDNIESILVRSNEIGTIISEDIKDRKVALMMNTRNSTFNQNINNSAIIGGNNLSIGNDNTLVTQNFEQSGSYCNLKDRIITTDEDTDEETLFYFISSVGATLTLLPVVSKVGIVMVIKNTTNGDCYFDSGTNQLDGVIGITTIPGNGFITIKHLSSNNYYTIG